MTTITGWTTDMGFVWEDCPTCLEPVFLVELKYAEGDEVTERDLSGRVTVSFRGPDVLSHVLLRPCEHVVDAAEWCVDDLLPVDLLKERVGPGWSA